MALIIPLLHIAFLNIVLAFEYYIILHNYKAVYKREVFRGIIIKMDSVVLNLLVLEGMF